MITHDFEFLAKPATVAIQALDLGFQSCDVLSYSSEFFGYFSHLPHDLIVSDILTGDQPAHEPEQDANQNRGSAADSITDRRWINSHGSRGLSWLGMRHRLLLAR